jgi:hypothetical protein
MVIATKAAFEEPTFAERKATLSGVEKCLHNMMVPKNDDW